MTVMSITCHITPQGTKTRQHCHAATGFHGSNSRNGQGSSAVAELLFPEKSRPMMRTKQCQVFR